MVLLQCVKLSSKYLTKPSVSSILSLAPGNSNTTFMASPGRRFEPLVVGRIWLSTRTAILCAATGGGGEKSTPATQRNDRQLKEEERSYLEEVLLGSKQDEGPKTTAQKVKKGAENTFFYAVFIASVGAISVLVYLLAESFWAPDSPQRIYSNALKLIRADDRCADLFGVSIAAHGEDSGRGRRRHIANKRYTTRDGQERIRIVFHIKGDKCTGRATAEVAKTGGEWDYRFLLVETDGLVPETITLVDHR